MKFSADHAGEELPRERDYTSLGNLFGSVFDEHDIRGKVSGLARLLGAEDDLSEVCEGRVYGIFKLATDLTTLTFAAGWLGMHVEYDERKIASVEDELRRERARVAELESMLKVYEVGGASIAIVPYAAEDELGQLANSQMADRLEEHALGDSDIDAVVEGHISGMGLGGSGPIDEKVYLSIKHGER